MAFVHYKVSKVLKSKNVLRKCLKFVLKKRIIFLAHFGNTAIVSLYVHFCARKRHHYESHSHSNVPY